MKIKEVFKSQYRASLEMLKQAILACPDSLWQCPEDKNQFWHIAYHVLFYAHFYLSPSEGDFVPWEKHKDEYTSLGNSQELSEPPFSKEEILAYHELCLKHVEEQVEALDLEGESGFYWLPFSKSELQIYNIRHIQQHTGELCQLLGEREKIDVSWVGMKAF